MLALWPGRRVPPRAAIWRHVRRDGALDLQRRRSGLGMLAVATVLADDVAAARAVGAQHAEHPFIGYLLPAIDTYRAGACRPIIDHDRLFRQSIGVSCIGLRALLAIFAGLVLRSGHNRPQGFLHVRNPLFEGESLPLLARLDLP